ncbi:FAD-binding protein [Bifidobacterium sp. ESL0745]|uniref:FAD-binding protein n=1 Tax=Bifidobacterium sp. ESL0745 TaxID=2983226 RepID=UPI0023F6C7C7|nr:FAD-binding protein [Bifidobacterium sp. ESL0745]MDF7665499.1 FAD-binding protein [Bifidobacterium sp. ESL0745]
MAQLTTIDVGGSVDRFIEPQSEAEFIEAVRGADAAGLPLLVIGGGSNLLAADDPFPGVVIRDARRGISVLNTDISANAGDGGVETSGTGRVAEVVGISGIDAFTGNVDGGSAGSSQSAVAGEIVEIVADAGANWDDFVAFCIKSGFSGVEGLSGVPGTVGGAVVQNIGAYGQEVGSSVTSVRVFDRKAGTIDMLSPADMRFGYRSSALKTLGHAASSASLDDTDDYFPTSRYVVLSATFTLECSRTGEVAFGQLAKALGVELGERMPIAEIRETVLKIRATKGMLEDPGRYASRWMRGCKDRHNVVNAVKAEDPANSNGQDMSDAQEPPEIDAIQGEAASGVVEYQPDFDRHSCGSFFTNPILTSQQAAKLPADAPRFDALLPDGKPGVKTSAAWLIDHAGFHKGYKVRPDAKAGLSTLHTLALTNRGGAQASDIAELAKTVQNGVEERFGIRLEPEPVVVGLDLS